MTATAQSNTLSRTLAPTPSPTLSEHQRTGTWLRTLDPAKRAAIRDLHEVQPAWNLVAIFFVAGWALGAVLVLSPWHLAIRLLGYTCIGVAIHGLVVLMHEGIHGSLFRSKRIDHVVSFLLGIPTLVSFTAYKITHLAHHRYNRTDADPDEFKNLTRNGRLLSLAFYAWMAAGTFVYFFFHVPITALQRGSPRERVTVLIEYSILAVVYAAAFATAWRLDALGVLLHCWILPMIVAVLFGNIRGWAEHMMTVPGDPLTQTRTVKSNAVVSFLTLNLNYHLEHHLFPGVPWYNLRKIHALLEQDFRSAGAFIYNSYLRFLYDAARAGVHGLAPKHRAVYADSPAQSVAFERVNQGRPAPVSRN